MVVEKLYESGDYIIVYKPYDMYINSDDTYEKVFFKFLCIFKVMFCLLVKKSIYNTSIC